MVRRFLFESFLLSLPIVGGMALYAFTYRDTFPAPRVVNNISLNEKLQLYKEEGLPPMDVIAVGSSMTLNNLSSKAIMEKLGPGAAYFNFGSWGFGLVNTYDLSLALTDHLHPHTVIVATNLMEFSTEISGMPLDTADVLRYLYGISDTRAYIEHGQPSYYLRNMEINRIRFRDPTNYEYLGFDASGGVSLDVPEEMRAKDRWEQPAPPLDRMVDSLYNVVGELARALQERHVKLVWIHTPFHATLIDRELRDRVRKHLALLRLELEPTGAVLLNAEDRTWPDSLFCDYSHFNKAGAREFTEHVMRKWTLDASDLRLP